MSLNTITLRGTGCGKDKVAEKIKKNKIHSGGQYLEHVTGINSPFDDI